MLGSGETPNVTAFEQTAFLPAPRQQRDPYLQNLTEYVPLVC
jgi:hypothetical protein